MSALVYGDWFNPVYCQRCFDVVPCRCPDGGLGAHPIIPLNTVRGGVAFGAERRPKGTTSEGTGAPAFLSATPAPSPEPDAGSPPTSDKTRPLAGSRAPRALSSEQP